MTLAAEEPVGRPRGLAEQILAMTFRFRRLADPDDPCGDEPCATCFAVHEKRVLRFVERNEPVHFLLPAFPAKSRNPGKVLGALPDLGERISVEFLQTFCELVSHVHAPGARILICSDGHVFADLLGIPDDDVTAYRAELRRIIDTLGSEAVGLYSLDDALGSGDYDEMRALLVERYGTPVERLRAEVRTDLSARAMFNGMHRFMVEDHVPLTPGTSRSQVSKQCKELAYRMIQRSRAWGDLVGDVFPDSLRLSIHPQHSHAGKIGFHLVRTKDNWLTPWHGVVVDDGRSVTLVKRSQAERAKASLVWRLGRPSHYVNPHAVNSHALPEENAS
ncbi:L-tyrosine/L-tryptophan isonitrile synthase family protein [Actinophytocola sp.]|uniref:L-tyrosine/L-tryptophan isonitrile synthase family protein n=1 Tax=Actinophytocola sp. TaxID=1872138 RepID=UPI00389B35BC